MESEFYFDEAEEEKIKEKTVDRDGSPQDIKSEEEKEHPPIPWKQMSVSEIASWNLYRELRKYDFISKDLRQQWTDEMKDLPQIRTMNMDILAAALSFIETVSGRITPDNFRSKAMDNVIEPIIPNPIKLGIDNYQENVRERDIIIQKIKASILRYITLITVFRSS